MKTTGLSLDQAPPIIIPFKFFLTASLFSVIVGIFLMIDAEAVFLSRWSPLALGITHLMTVGFLAQVMTGAMIQLLPVLAGSPIPAVTTVSRIIHLSLFAGALMMGLGFIRSHQSVLVTGAGLVLFAITLFLLAMVVSLISSKSRHDNAIPIGLGWMAVIPTLAIGVYMVLGLSGMLTINDMPVLIAVHLSWGLLGWVGIVLFATIIQILPIFYITGEMPVNIRNISFIIVFALLALFSLSQYINSELLAYSLPMIVALFLLLSLALFQMIWKRRRKIVDMTLVFLWTGLICLALAAMVWMLGDNALLVGVLLLGGVCITIPIGIIYKVIPFLCWFHLQSLLVKQGKLSSRLPSMKHYINEVDAKRHYLLHLAAIALTAAATLMPATLARTSGIALSLSSLYFLKNLLFALLRFNKQQRALLDR
ncbi:MAG: hypothetical protein KUF77_13500 [Candidatus Thiodiazotropha sp. (ex Lucina aurantia)]|nr:hypothetical protein [Candidatus Thiodiazotropha sp. (ex Lucina pensylvanica)]MBT3015908.1 hypothetical protein [Candidatus Thiodiazotropha taylori]MBT3052246.1 hypothetical protein [Candidatus Thiodiazotropha sp. (ex Codakia orbicularis)]MBV2104034.1 hypothetical protein [Candidatus Thiodiazotropha sp. (ex Lucina aurantia)]MBT3024422.1 hypothetical protein [Candidatus Thiodiazotropha taylori]